MKLFYTENRKLTPRELTFVLEMSQFGDATRAAHRAYVGLSDQAARITANNLMRRTDIASHVEYLRKRYTEIQDYVRKI